MQPGGIITRKTGYNELFLLRLHYLRLRSGINNLLVWWVRDSGPKKTR